MQIISCVSCGTVLGYVRQDNFFSREPGDESPYITVDDTLKIQRKNKRSPSFSISDTDNQVCPVCQGRTTMPAGFYTEGATEPEQCRSCSGQGYISVGKYLICPNCGQENGIF